MTLAIDVSNYSSDLTPAALQAWKDAGVGLVIAQAIDPPDGYPESETRAQIQACADAGMASDAYFYLWTHSDVRADMLSKLGMLDGLEDSVRKVWLDVEDVAGATVADRLNSIRTALSTLDEWASAHGKPRAGLYLGRWWWTAYVADTKEFADRELWAAQYDGVVDTSVFTPFGGWSACRIKQYAGDATLAGVSGIDLNVLSPEEEASLTTPQSQEEPMPDIDSGWQSKKDAVVQLAGELVTVASQIKAAALRKGGPVRGDVLPLADAVLNRAQEILK